MTALPAYIAVLPGFFVGLLCGSLVTHWVALLLVALGIPGRRAGAAPSGRVWAIVFTLVHPVFWLLFLGLPFGIHRLIVKTPTAPWLWFFSAITATLVAMTVVGVIFARKAHKRVGRKVAA